MVEAVSEPASMRERHSARMASMGMIMAGSSALRRSRKLGCQTIFEGRKGKLTIVTYRPYRKYSRKSYAPQASGPDTPSQHQVPTHPSASGPICP